jgi:hypothetical protein
VVPALLALAALAQACAAQASLVPGAPPGDCRSALRVGIVACQATDAAAAQSGPAPAAARAVSEAQVDAFLQQWGKPPREAVRALLDPSDENILAWIGSQRSTLSVARYVATRMTELQARTDDHRATAAAPAVNPAATGPAASAAQGLER